VDRRHDSYLNRHDLTIHRSIVTELHNFIARTLVAAAVLINRYTILRSIVTDRRSFIARTLVAAAVTINRSITEQLPSDQTHVNRHRSNT